MVCACTPLTPATRLRGAAHCHQEREQKIKGSAHRARGQMLVGPAVPSASLGGPLKQVLRPSSRRGSITEPGIWSPELRKAKEQPNGGPEVRGENPATGEQVWPSPRKAQLAALAGALRTETSPWTRCRTFRPLIRLWPLGRLPARVVPSTDFLRARLGRATRRAAGHLRGPVTAPQPACSALGAGKRTPHTPPSAVTLGGGEGPSSL